jgi:GNAT superfamily N-acetyltransferase
MENLKPDVPFLIREANPGDADSIAEFQVLMAMETENYALDPVTVETGVKAVFTDTGKGCYYVAESEGRVIASTLITYEWSDWRNRTICWIQSVFVVPQYRGLGVFKAIYLYIKNKVEQSSEIGGIRLYVDHSNKNAQEVYRKLGMDGSHYRVFEWMKL